ncbi:Cache domain-containing protein [Duganella sp. CF402]|uniref:cache domain-containing protein n=1 Tax=unclassified Duganella TaxID=2636909 RepID=UPI0008D7FCA8|nr:MULTISPECIES: cache domain-containing protein [unclassified Duganella]RZT09749.1 cache domain-containing protein [Duganella sp. BK701]SEL44494.1 Cache domain-containing protein [Duganella sp. CF402]
MTYKKIAAFAMLAGMMAVASATPEDDTQALVKKASAYIKANGIDKACVDFADPAKGFRPNGSYVYVHDIHAKMLCNPGSPRTVGKDMIEVKDMDGKYFNKEMVSLATTKGSGWVEYKWTNPATQKMQDKKSYIERQGDLIVGSGFYK